SLRREGTGRDRAHDRRDQSVQPPQRHHQAGSRRLRLRAPGRGGAITRPPRRPHLPANLPIIALDKELDHMIPAAYRNLLRNIQARRLLLGLGVSALGDGMSMVSVAWLAMLIAPPRTAAMFVGLAIAAYTLAGAAGALTLGRFLRQRVA